MKKGFTLIELLAVIIILSIIALIAVPIIFNIIENSRDNALKNSASGLIRAASYYRSSNSFENIKIKTFESSNDYDGLEIKGEKKKGIVNVYKNGDTSVAIYDNNKCAYKTKKGNKILLEKVVSSDECLNKLVVPICVFKENSIYECDVNDEVTKEFYLVENNNNSKDVTLLFSSEIDDNNYSFDEAKNKIYELRTDWTNIGNGVNIPTETHVRYLINKDKNLIANASFWTKTYYDSYQSAPVKNDYNKKTIIKEKIYNNITASFMASELSCADGVEAMYAVENGNLEMTCDNSYAKYPLRPTITILKSLIEFPQNESI